MQTSAATTRHFAASLKMRIILVAPAAVDYGSIRVGVWIGGIEYGAAHKLSITFFRKAHDEVAKVGKAGVFWFVKLAFKHPKLSVLRMCVTCACLHLQAVKALQ